MKFENTEVFNFEGAIRGMRFAMKSNDKTDTEFVGLLDFKGNMKNCLSRYAIDGTQEFLQIGPNDMKLCRNLIKASQGGREEKTSLEPGQGFAFDFIKEDGNNAHRKFIRQILVSVDITAPLYFWSEFDTYKVGTVANSESTMHTILKDKISFDNFDKLFAYDRGMFLADIINEINRIKESTHDDLTKLRMIKQILPTGWLQKRHITFNYEVIRTIYHQRKNHRLCEWNEAFVEWVKGLPYAEELIIG